MTPMSYDNGSQTTSKSDAPRKYVMWAGTVKSLPLSERIRVTAKADFDVLTITPVDYEMAIEGGLSAKDIGRLAKDNGITIKHMDPLTRWTPIWQPGNIIDKRLLPFFDCEQDKFFRIAEELGIESMHVLGMFEPNSLPIDKITESYAAVCDRAAQYGIRCSLEFIPFMGIPDLATAWSIVKNAGRPNSGIIFDFWHFMRSSPDFELLGSIPKRVITDVQFADATREIPKGVSIVADCFLNRVPAGEGEFPIKRILQILDQIEGLTNVGPEIFSSAFDKMKGDEIARISSSSTRQTLEDARVSGMATAPHQT
jgi:sugar phosphate isomerase/epimerase